MRKLRYLAELKILIEFTIFILAHLEERNSWRAGRKAGAIILPCNIFFFLFTFHGFKRYF